MRRLRSVSQRKCRRQKETESSHLAISVGACRFGQSCRLQQGTGLRSNLLWSPMTRGMRCSMPKAVPLFGFEQVIIP
jgi:hypothetical protein